MANLQIHLLGGLQIRLGDGDPPHFVSSKAPALLAYLAVTRRPHRREALAGLLWGEMPDDAAANNLRQALSSLRKAAEPHLRIDRDEVAFNADAPYFLDVELFSDLLRLQRGQPPAQGIGLLRRALSLYQGEFLAGFHVRDAPDFEEWVLGQRVQLRDLALDGLESLTRLLIESGQCQEAIPVTAQLLALDPWREEAHRWRMLALARCRQTSAALAQYRSCRAILRQEFDADPSAETTALYERIRAAQNAPRHNLPGATTGFVGREEELAALAGLLAHPANRLLTLLGPGGVGKTRLAVEVAQALVPPDPRAPGLAQFDRIVFVPLVACASRAQLLDVLVERLRAAPGEAAPLDRIAAALRGRRTLIVLDNFEQLVECAGDVVADLLALAPGLHAVVTSRRTLGLDGEHVVALHGLPLPHDQADLEEAAHNPALALFVDRAQSVRPDFHLGARNLATLTALMHRLDGLPLAVELAASRVRSFAPAEMLAMLDRPAGQRGDLVARSGPRAALDPRHASMQQVVAWSWGLLDDRQRVLLQSLVPFDGGCTAAAAAAVLDDPQAALCLDELVGHSLLQARAGMSGSTRFAPYEPVREFAALHTDAATAQRLRARHRAWVRLWAGQLPPTP
ncbi:MAG: AAA family ATPase, partial [Caldilineales bacterium]|nr:AAA family ATPase [Caldilineales bacterium]